MLEGKTNKEYLVHSQNKEMIERIAKRFGYNAQFVENGNGWMFLNAELNQ